MHRQPLSEIAHAGLGGAVCRDFSQRLKGIHRGNIDDIASALEDHVLAKNLRRKKRAKEVQVEDKLNAVHRQVVERYHSLFLGRKVLAGEKLLGRGALRVVAARAVDEDIHRTKARLDFLVGFLNARLFEHVAGKSTRDSAPFGDLVSHLLRELRLQVQDGDLGAALGHRLRHNTAQHSAPAGNHCDLVFEVHLKWHGHNL